MKGTMKMGSSLLSAALLLALTAAPVQAENRCKGMEQSSCASHNSCRWINGYKRSTGKEVAGYCRSLPSAKKPLAPASQKS